MTSAIEKPSDAAALLEKVVIQGDLALLSDAERVFYYHEVCKSLGLNPLTHPFDYIRLNNKLTLYARRDATDQLRRIHYISITKVEHTQTGDLYVVTATAEAGGKFELLDGKPLRQIPGRTDSAIGAVSIAGLKGDALANAMMKAETKAKRRVTLSLAGLGLLDESEASSVPDATPAVVTETSEIGGGAETSSAQPTTQTPVGAPPTPPAPVTVPTSHAEVKPSPAGGGEAHSTPDTGQTRQPAVPALNAMAWSVLEDNRKSLGIPLPHAVDAAKHLFKKPYSGRLTAEEMQSLDRAFALYAGKEKVGTQVFSSLVAAAEFVRMETQEAPLVLAQEKEDAKE